MNSKKNLKRNLLICLLAGSAVMYTLPLHAATSVIANNTLPTGGKVMAGNITLPNWVNTPDHGKLVMDITQSTTNGVIKWDSFNVGGSATVNFKGPQVEGGYNTLNYVNAGGSMSQIYGTINANNNGNIFIVNPAGVQIGNSAQINVGSLHVSNKYLNEKELGDFAGKITPDMINTGKDADAVLMSLGNINANKVTFEGDGRIVIDSERIKDEAGNDKLDYQNINITTSADNTDNIIIGYDAYDETNKTYAGANADGKGNEIATVNGNAFTKADGYMWVEDVDQLQAINTNLGGNYALRNSIDATATDNGGEGFNPIGLVDDSGKVIVNKVDNSDKYGFYGNFDGIDYNIFGLTINRSNEANVGLFGVAHDANINNVTLVGGSITGGSVVGSVVGAALGNTHITNATNSASVTGNTDVGGIVGYSGKDINDGAGDKITVSDTVAHSHFTNLINTGAVHSNGENDKISNAGGLIGYMYNGTLDGNSYNLGDVSGDGYNVGGLVGHAVNSTIGDGTNLVYNRLDVTGAYNVGGIVGNMEGSTVKNAENSGTVLASGSLTDEYNYHTDITDVNKLPASISLNDGIVSIDVNVANVGGIAGTSSDSSTIKDVTNTGDVSSGKGNDTENVNNQGYDYEYYTAGNVGGIVGSAVDTNITNATNRENEIRGAHNVGGVVGYFSGNGTIDKGINDGGDIMATGAHNGKGFVMESVRQSGDEDFIIGNIGGIVGYMEGNDVKVTGSANRGTVHTENIEDADNVLTISKAANVGGIVGKIDANTNEAGLLTDFHKGKYENASVSNSYNTGNVTGYTGVGGVIGMMYNGSVAGSYNQGAINTTRQVDRGGGSDIDPLNMGGIVGDTTEQTNASAVIYDVYNEGQIGDENFEFYARHVGGIVGRLSGTVEKAYNTGDIYNNDTAVGGIVGWWYNGNIKNVFNTGNITVRSATELQVGGIAGAAETGDKTLENAYNLGTIRGYKESVDNSNNPQDGNDSDIYVGGIIGRARGRNALIIKNVYTMGNLYAGVGTYNNATGTYSYEHTKTNGLGAIYGGDDAPTLEGANYIVRDIDYKDYFKDLSRQNNVNDIEYGKRYIQNEYEFVNVGAAEDEIFSNQDGGAVNNATDNNWRIYEGSTTPILNAFLPNTEKYFVNKNLSDEGITSIQYGTAYDPLLTIINAKRDLSYDWNELGISGAASLAVYGGGLTLDNVDTSSGNGYYSGLLYTDKDLTLIATNKNNEPDETKVSGDIGLGSGAELYGSSVKIEADGTVTVYGSVTATGETADSTGDINITAGDVDVYGTLTTGKPVSIAGIEDSAHDVDTNFEHVNNPNEAMIHISERFAHEINSVNGATSNITINAGTKLVVGDDGKPILDAEGNKQYVNIGDGNVNLYFGNKEQGLITTGGDLNVTGTGDVYVDSDLDISGDLTLEGTGADSEVVLDITNIGQVQAKNELAENTDSKVTAAEKLHEFMHHFSNNDADTDNLITLNSASGDAKLAVDMWDGNAFNLSKFDSKDHNFKKELNSMNVTVNGEELGKIGNNHVKDYTYIWVSDGEQLKGIQQSAEKNNDFLSFNFALKNDINASDIGNGYEAIGGTTGYNGTFDGRGNRIIGLEVDNEINTGIFSKINQTGTVKNLNVYSGTFTGTDTAGAVAGINNGTIENITAFGNTVTVKGNDGNAGGIAGTNSGIVDDVESSGSVIGEGDNAIVGGLVGTNEKVNNESKATISNSYSNSAVTSTSGTNAGLGGVVGVNEGTVSLVDSLGVTNGTNSTNVGGVIGINSGTLNSAYNESIVNGNSNVGGIIGENSTGGKVTNIVNATGVTGEDESEDNVSQYVGGLVGTNSGSVTNGRNNGTITGTNYVGGMVGSNAQGATLTNLVNDSSAAIEGEQYVGGIAGSNAGSISATDNGLINRGSITGNKFVGGVAGVNEEGGTIENTISNIELNVKTPYTDDNNTDNDPAFFGGVVGQNSGTVIGARNQSSVDVAADGATFVGGIIGQNTSTGSLQGQILNEGTVSGLSNVGGIIGENENAQLLNNADDNERLKITNTGSVSAIQGGAAGIFYSNNISGTEGDTNANAINNVDITNSGTVTGGTDEKSVTGGLFGINSGNITNSTLSNTGVVTGGGTVGGLIGENTGNATGSAFTNEGIVEGNTNVGGLFGTNSGIFSTSSLISTVNAQVIGTQNVGGLIGTNTGTIIGGRNEAKETDEDRNVTAEKDSYYKYQVYNNGTITVTGSGSNIGGLIGENATGGSLTAGYNTGAVNAKNSSNVGGIAGSNSGTIDQVFNTVYNTDGTKGAITGGTNVGGLVGTNSGTLSNAYNTTAVNGAEGSTGNAVGVNDGKDAKVNFVYDVTNTKNKLIGKNAGSVNGSYALQESGQVENAANGIAYISVKDKNDKGQYTSLTGSDWKFYDGQQTPLLSVFLTKVKINQDKVNEYMSAHKVYNGTEQKLTANDIKALIDNEAIYVEGLTKEQAFEAFYNNIDLISSVGHTNAGQYSDWLYSQQIASSGSGDTFNPNNLGYDIALTGDINKVKVDIDLNTIERIYGDTTILNNGDYGYSYKFTNADKKYEDVLKNQLKNVLDFAYSEDGALIIVNGEERTNNKGDYTYKGTLTLNSTNFEFVVDKGDSQTETSTSSTLTTYGTSIVHAKKINVDDFLATIVYGNKNNDFVISGIDEVIKDQLAYEEDVLDANLTDIKTIGDYEVIRDGRDTADVGTYDDSITANISINNGNYELTGSAADGTITGNVKVTPVQLDIVLGNVGHEYGSPNLDDYKASIGTNGLVNGDNGNVSIDVNKVVDDALKDNNKYTDNVGDYTWVVNEGGISANGFNLGNYIVTVTNEGKSEVTPAKLDIVLGDVSHKYGSPNLDDYKASIGTNGLVNGDNGNVSIDVNKVVDDALKDNNKYTDNVGDYTWVVSKDGISANGFNLGNYIVTVTNEGKSEVTPAKLNIKVDNANTTVGKMPGELTGTVEGLTNGDTLPAHDFALNDDSLISVSGNHEDVIGIVIGGKFYELGDADWSNGLFANYDVNYEMGDLAVSVVEMPDNWPNNRWDYLFGDNPFDRNENFRERKAEVNFVDGAMEI